MTPRPKRRTLAERDAQAIQTPPAPPQKALTRPRGLGRGAPALIKATKNNNATSATKPSKAGRKGTPKDSSPRRRGAPATGRVIVNIWIDRVLWAQARTLYLRAHPGHEVALVEWVDGVINTYLDHRRDALISSTMGDEGQIVKITLTPATKQRIIDTVEDHSLHGRAISRSAVISAALRRAVADAGGSTVPVFQGRLPRGRRPQP